MIQGLWFSAGLVVIVWATGVCAQAESAAPVTLAVGDWRLDPVVELQTRGEYRHDLDDRDRVTLVERARLGVDASRGSFEARLVFQDARSVELSGGYFIAGSPAIASTGAYEAWAEAHTDGSRPSYLRVGRQAVVWGEGRLLGSADKSPTGRSLDAVRGRLVVDDAAVEILGAVLQDWPSTPGFSVDPYGELFGARAEWASDPLFAIEVDALARLARRDPSLQTAVEGQTYTGSARLHGDDRRWTWGAEAAYQFGHVDGVTRFGEPEFTGRRAAWAAAGHLAHTFERAYWEPTVQVAAAYATGDEAGATYRAFDPLLPDVRTWHGAAEAFAWSNEAEASARGAIVPWTEGVVALEYRYVVLAQPGSGWQSAYLQTIGQASGNTHAGLGHEVDATIRWSPWAPVLLEVGYSVLVLGDGAKAILAARQTGVASLSHCAYAEARVDF